MDIDIDLSRKYMSEDPVIDNETGYALNYPIGLQMGSKPDPEIVKVILAKRELAGIVVEDDLLGEVNDPDAGRNAFDFFDDEQENP